MVKLEERIVNTLVVDDEGHCRLLVDKKTIDFDGFKHTVRYIGCRSLSAIVRCFPSVNP